MAAAATAAVSLLLAGAPLALAQAVDSGPAALQAKYASLKAALDNNPFKRQLVLESREGDDRLAGDIYAVVEHPFADVAQRLQTPAAWCEVLMLHLNTKNCSVRGSGDQRAVSVALGRKFDQPLADAQEVAFAFRLATASADDLDVRLSADSGPLSTRDYRIELSATPIAEGRTFIHLGYSYAYGTAARLAMKGYLATLGSDKVGFTREGPTGFIGGVRGVVERNTMRYYLAIDAYLDAPGASQLDARLGGWFDATEQYARQLHEIDRGDYLAMKRHEFERMRGGK